MKDHLVVETQNYFFITQKCACRLKALLESGGIEVPEGNGEHGIEKQEGASKSG